MDPLFIATGSNSSGHRDPSQRSQTTGEQNRDPFVVVLGIAQDGGHPQPGCTRACCAGIDPISRHLPACLGVIDPESQQRWIIDATPDPSN